MVFLTGAPASGKTTLGRRLAAALGVPFVDLDAEIVRRAGRSIPEIFAADGEAAFRDIESQTLTSLAVVGGTPTLPAANGSAAAGVVALGGGTLLRDANRAFCESHGTVFCLDTPSGEELARRLGAAQGTRPLGDRAKERAAHYASFPNRVAGWFELEDSLVVVGRGIAPAILAGKRVVADATVADLWQEKLGLNLITAIPSGEQHKTIQTVTSLWSAFAKAGLGRKDVVTALGGGVTGDLTGFAAATWMRGIDWINVPTTLLSMVDASTGGKTGCDLPEGKNLAGAFHAPRLVVIDVDFLKTLPEKILRDGKAEMIKHEIIKQRTVNSEQRTDAVAEASCSGCQSHVSDDAHVSHVPNSKDVADQGASKCKPMPSAREIYDNLAVKVGIVREDPFETKGRRLLLNCGHTVGHAIEKATNYAVTHGEAVAIGCVEEAKIAVRRGLAPKDWPGELERAFEEAGFEIQRTENSEQRTEDCEQRTVNSEQRTEDCEQRTEDCEQRTVNSEQRTEAEDLSALVHLMKGDKKRAGAVVTFALPCGWGDVRAVPIDLDKETP